jgi:hypothetical protein
MTVAAVFSDEAASRCSATPTRSAKSSGLVPGEAPATRPIWNGSSRIRKAKASTPICMSCRPRRLERHARPCRRGSRLRRQRHRGTYRGRQGDAFGSRSVLFLFLDFAPQLPECRSRDGEDRLGKHATLLTAARPHRAVARQSDFRRVRGPWRPASHAFRRDRDRVAPGEAHALVVFRRHARFRPRGHLLRLLATQTQSSSATITSPGLTSAPRTRRARSPPASTSA